MTTKQAKGSVHDYSVFMQTDDYAKHRLLPLFELSLRRIIALECLVDTCRNLRKSQQTVCTESEALTSTIELVKDSVSRCMTVIEENAKVPSKFHCPSQKKGVSSGRKPCEIVRADLMAVLLSHIQRFNLKPLLVTTTTPKVRHCSRQSVGTLQLNRKAVVFSDATETERLVAESPQTGSHELAANTSVSESSVSSPSAAVMSLPVVTSQKEPRTFHGLSPAAKSTESSLAAMAPTHISGLAVSTETSPVATSSQSHIGSEASGDVSQTVTTMAAHRGSLLPTVTSQFSEPLVSAKSSLAAMASQHLSGPTPSTAATTSHHTSVPLAAATPSLTNLARQHHSGSVSSESLSQSPIPERSLLAMMASQRISGRMNSAASVAVTTSQASCGQVTSATPSLARLAMQHASSPLTSVSSESFSQPASDGTSSPNISSASTSSHGRIRPPALMAVTGHVSGTITGGPSLASLAMHNSTSPSSHSASPIHTPQLESGASRQADVAPMLDSVHGVCPVHSADHVGKPKVKPPPGFQASHTQSARCGAVPSNITVSRPPPGFRNRKQAVDLRQLLGDASLQTSCVKHSPASPPKENRRRLPGQMFAKPSLFGATLCTSPKPRSLPQKGTLLFRKFRFPLECLKAPDCVKLDDIVRFNFLTPSPDDIVKEKQKAAFVNPGERKYPALERNITILLY